jgi:cell pole-organizing protein PopZ
MSEETKAAEAGDAGEGGQEPSMEDILASIRRILSEEEEEERKAQEATDAEPASEPEPEPAPEPAPAPEPEPAPEVEFTQPVAEDVLELTEAMVTTPQTVVSEPTARLSTDVLSELARAILDRRDLSVDGGGATLEGIVREMLRPILREWLDRNLPYLIERLVKKEIDYMINRAERLE